MRQFTLGALMLLALLPAARAGTIVWDFDGTETSTEGLPAGAIDGDLLVTEGWQPSPQQALIGIPATDFEVEGGLLTQRFSTLTPGQLPTSNPSHIHSTGIKVGDLRGALVTSGVTPTVLNLANVETEYQYLVISGRFGWASAGGEVGMIIYPVTEEAENWFTISLRITTVQTNITSRQVFDLTQSPRTSTYAGTLRGMLMNLYGMWNFVSGEQVCDPTFMRDKWINEFNPTDTVVELDWIALTSDPDFRLGETVNDASRWNIFE